MTYDLGETRGIDMTVASIIRFDFLPLLLLGFFFIKIHCTYTYPLNDTDENVNGL